MIEAQLNEMHNIKSAKIKYFLSLNSKRNEVYAILLVWVRMCVWQVAPSANPTPEFDPADLLPVTFGRGVSSLGGNSVYSCWMETDAYASRAERLIDSPVIRYQSMKRGQRFLKTAPTCSAAHRSSPPWLKLAIDKLKKKISVLFQMPLPASSEKNQNISDVQATWEEVATVTEPDRATLWFL